MTREFTPDYRNLEKAARNEWVDRLPLYEHAIGSNAVYETTGYRPFPMMNSGDPSDMREGFRQYWDFWRRMGYDTASMEFCMTPVLPGGGALGGHKAGCIQNHSDFERYPWQDIPELYFNRYAPMIRMFAETCPPGMKGVGGVGNGVFECVQDLTGYTGLCFIKADDQELYADLFRAVGRVLMAIWERFLAEYADVYCVLRFGDDLGFKNQTLLSPDDIRSHVITQYRPVIARIHATGKPFLLHSCGCIFDVMEDLIAAGIDAKHSNEDQIGHFSVWVERYGDRIGNFGGIDTDVLCRETPGAIRDYIVDCLARVRGKGGIAFSSGNSIPDYVPIEGYTAMIETVRAWRGA